MRSVLVATAGGTTSDIPGPFVIGVNVPPVPTPHPIDGLIRVTRSKVLNPFEVIGVKKYSPYFSISGSKRTRKSN